MTLFINLCSNWAACLCVCVSLTFTWGLAHFKMPFILSKNGCHGGHPPSLFSSLKLSSKLQNHSSHFVLATKRFNLLTYFQTLTLYRSRLNLYILGGPLNKALILNKNGPQISVTWNWDGTSMVQLFSRGIRILADLGSAAHISGGSMVASSGTGRLHDFSPLLLGLGSATYPSCRDCTGQG